MNARALYLDGAFSLFHRATGTETAVLMCPPFGWEDVCSYRSRREWAGVLAAAGFPVLRFDYPGTGDSAGTPGDPGLVDAWTEAVERAARWLRAETGCRRTAAIGIGLGGLLAWRAAAGGAPIDDLVLWAVPAQGRSLVRELRAFARMETASLVAAGAPEPPPATDGAIAPGGFLLAAETIEAVESIDLATLPLPDAQQRRVLLIGRDGIAVDKALVAQLDQSGASVDVSTGEGYGEMMLQPDHARAPRTVFERTTEWLRNPVPAVRRTADAPPVPAGKAATLDGFRETPFTVEQPFGELFGILAEPDAPAGDLCAVFLNAAAIRRVGPNRMWVDIGRRWAARGVPTLRLDLEGIGDSDGSGEAYSDFRKLYVPDFVRQARAALDTLEQRGAGRRFVLLGLCSGAYWSFQAALEDERVTAAFMLNPRLLVWADELEAERDARRIRRQFFRASSWRRVLSGEIPMDGERLRALAGWALRAPLRLAGSAPPPVPTDEIERDFDRLRAKGARALLAFSERGEPLREELEAAGQLSQTDRWPNIAVETIPGRDHTLRPVWTHPHVHQVLDRALERELS